VLGRGAAAAAGDVEPAVARPFADLRAIDSGVSSYSPKALGRPAFGMAGDAVSAIARSSSTYGPQLLRAERAVQADRERARVAHRVVERLGGLARERAARRVGDRAGDEHRQAHARAAKRLLDRAQRRLGVQRVEDRLDEQQVDAASSSPSTPRVGAHQLVEADRAEPGSLTSGEMEAVLLVGPSTPATKRGCPGVARCHSRTASRASARPRD
jgi:hypothetical protein